MRLWLVCLGAMWLAACGAIPESVDAAGGLGPPVLRFAADGRISLRQEQRSDHLHFTWRHAPGRDNVLFSSPLGQGLAEMGRDAGGAWLVVPGQAERRSTDLRTLAQQVFGTPLPLDELADWLGGARPELNGDVDGWRIAVTESAPYGRHRLPRRLEAQRGDVELKIVIDGWDEGG